MSSEEQIILLVDPDIDYLDWASKTLEVEGVKVLRCDTADKAVKVIQKVDVDLVIADSCLTPFDGLELLKHIKAHDKNALMILTTASPTTAQIINATQLGARDVLRKESLPFELRPAVESALQLAESRKSSHNSDTEVPKLDSRVKMIGISRPIQNVFKIVGKVSQSDAPVLIIGESGTGKELIANAIHEYSPRRNKEMVALNCGAIPDNLLESELFGHEKGSFTGAMTKRVGRFEQCDQGTLFLDEIGDMPASVQVKLLRILQEGTFSRVGGNETLKTDVRIVAATNKDLANEVAEGRFREDLYYRLNVVELHLPPLRERKEDIPILAEFFLKRLTKKGGMAQTNFSQEALHSLQQHRWPGNVRELENTIARACALASTDFLLPEDIPFARSPFNEDRKLNEAFETLLSLAPEGNTNLVDWVQKQLITRTLDEVSGDVKEASVKLGISTAQLKQYSAKISPKEKQKAS